MIRNETTNRVAVYWDFENIHASLMDRAYGEGAYRAHRGQHPELVTLAPIMAYAASLGEVVIRKAYADWQWFHGYRKTMLDTSIEQVLTPTRPGAKNSADMRLLADALDDMNRYPGITHVLVLSGDGDFLPLAQRVRSSGRHIIGIGVQDHSSSHWRQACNVFHDYEAITGISMAPRGVPVLAFNGTANGQRAKLRPPLICMQQHGPDSTSKRRPKIHPRHSGKQATAPKRTLVDQLQQWFRSLGDLFVPVNAVNAKWKSQGPSRR